MPMIYMGSKSRYAKYIIPFLEKERRPGQYVVDIFCGGCNLIDKVSGLRIANDKHKYLIALMRAVQNGWVPPSIITEERYIEVRNNPDQFEDHEVGFVGFGATYAGKWFGGYARGFTPKGDRRNYVDERARSLVKQSKLLQGIKFRCEDYRTLSFPKQSIIYADPPYQGTTPYLFPFNHTEFWDWIRTKTSEGHRCYVSEYNAPDDFKCLWAKDRSSSLTPDTGSKKATERLFTLK